MRTIINYLIQCFCKHEFEYEDSHFVLQKDYDRKEGPVRYLYCPKCGYHSSHWKTNL